MEKQRIHSPDFRNELYKKYRSTFKNYLENDDPASTKSVFEICRRRFLPLLSDFQKEDIKILELGCGSGYLLQFLKKEGFKNTYGIDISTQQIDIAKAKGLNADVVDIFEFLKTNETKYDVIFALDFVEHFYKHELLELFSRINNVLNDKGVFILHTPNGQGLFPGRNIYGDLTHLTIFSPNSLTQILKITGFEAIKFYETGPVAKNFKGIIRLMFWQVIKFIVRIIRIIETGEGEKIITQDFVCSASKIQEQGI